MFQLRFSGRGQFVRIFVTQLIEIEFAPLGYLDPARDCLRVVGKQPMHLLRGFEISLAILKQAITGLLNRAAMADAGEHILQSPSLGDVIMHIVGCQHRHTIRPAEPVEIGQTSLIVGLKITGSGER